MAWDFQQFDILTSVDSDKPVQPPVKLRTSKRYSVNSLTLIEYSSDEQRLWSDCAYAQADLSPCWSHIPHCRKSNALALIIYLIEQNAYVLKFCSLILYTLFAVCKQSLQIGFRAEYLSKKMSIFKQGSQKTITMMKNWVSHILFLRKGGLIVYLLTSVRHFSCKCTSF